jgi:hypothetical protein
VLYVCADPMCCTSEVTAQGNDMGFWRSRMYVVWFCYVYEKLAAIPRPVSAIEELFLHFRSHLLGDLAPLYAGAGACDENLSQEELKKHATSLKRYYSEAILLLDACR